MLRRMAFSVCTCTAEPPLTRAWIKGTAITSATMPMISSNFLFMRAPSTQRDQRSDRNDHRDGRQDHDRRHRERALRERLVADDRQHETPYHGDVEAEKNALQARDACHIDRQQIAERERIQLFLTHE